ncbi:MAG: cell division protein FtsW [Victivallales bacterium]|nr:cell division protein FtsW [Victivallales bacterium]
MLELHYTQTDIELQERRKRLKSQFSMPLLMSVTAAAMILFGLSMLYSTTSGGESGGRIFFIKQSVWILIGGLAAVTIYFVGYRKLSKLSIVWLVLSAAGLAVALFFPEVNGARRWIRFSGISIQPSEVSKIALLLYLADYLPRRQRFINTFEGILPAFAWAGLIAGLICLGKDLGNTLLLGFTVMLVLFVAGLRLRWFFIPLASLPVLVYSIMSYDTVRWARMTSFMNPEATEKTSGYQLWNSLLALGSGGWQGLGFTKSRMKAMYLPEAHTDFILSIVGEELGFISIVLIILGYALITFCGVWISMFSRERSGMLLGIGITSLIACQAIINLGVVCGALPTKGMPAPLISYGGSNMLSCLCGLALILSIDRETRSGQG